MRHKDHRDKSGKSDKHLDKTSENLTQSDSEPISIHITDTFDLHSIPARDIEAVVEEYLHQARKLGLLALRIIHGRGIGVQRQTVRRVLQRTPFVTGFCDAPAEAGGWGATMVDLAPED